MYAIRSQRPCAPGVLTSYSVMFAIEEEVGEARLLQIKAVALFLLVAIVQLIGVEVKG